MGDQKGGTDTVVDVVHLEQARVDAESRISKLNRALAAARREASRRQLRLAAVAGSVPPWAIALGTGSIAAFVLCLLVMRTTNAGAWTLLSCVGLGYVFVGGAIFGFLRDEAGETDENRRRTRADAVAAARGKVDRAVTDLTVAQAGLTAIQAALVAGRAQVALRAAGEVAQFGDRPDAAASRRAALLSVDPGRLYPDEFERFVGQVFAHLGYVVQLTGKTGDQGVDVLAERAGERLAVQVKRYGGAVGNGAVQEVFAGMHHHRCSRCAVVTNNYFTSAATALAKSTGCLLIDRDSIPALIRGELI